MRINPIKHETISEQKISPKKNKVANLAQQHLSVFERIKLWFGSLKERILSWIRRSPIESNHVDTTAWVGGVISNKNKKEIEKIKQNGIGYTDYQKFLNSLRKQGYSDADIAVVKYNLDGYVVEELVDVKWLPEEPMDVEEFLPEEPLEAEDVEDYKEICRDVISSQIRDNPTDQTYALAERIQNILNSDTIDSQEISRCFRAMGLKEDQIPKFIKD